MTSGDFIKNIDKASQAPDNPYDVFKVWINEAMETEKPYPTAMSIASIDPDGTPSVRVVLMRHWDENGFVFYTNSTSRKGTALKNTPKAGLNFWWPTLERQVRIEGTVSPVSTKQSDDYYAQRPRGSRIGAWASDQSSNLESRSLLTERIAELEKEYEGQEDIPRPEHWYGYCVKPFNIEFWQEGLYRIHTRLFYSKDDDGWKKQLLFP